MRNNKMVKCLRKNIVFMLIEMLLFGCQNSQSNDKDDLHLLERYQVIESFYKAYEEKDYEKMYDYLTPEMKEIFSKQVQSIPKAKLVSIRKNNSQTWDNGYWINVDLEIETTKSSSLYPDTTWSLYILTQEIDHHWLIVDMTTG